MGWTGATSFIGCGTCFTTGAVLEITDDADAVLLMGVAKFTGGPVDMDELLGAAVDEEAGGAAETGAGCGHHDGFACSGLQI